MITTHIVAWNEMCQRVRDVIGDTGMHDLVTYKPELRYFDQMYNTRPPANKLWCRISIAQAGVKKRTLGRPARLTQAGSVDIGLFVPLSDPRAAEYLQKVAALLVKCWSSNTANVDFFNVVPRDMPKEDPWHYKRVYATYNYDTRE